MRVKGARDYLRPFFNGFNKTENSSTMLRKKRKSWNGFPYEKQNSTVTEASQQERSRK